MKEGKVKAGDVKADIGVIGLAVMGQNLALNIESRGYTVAVYNRTAEKTRDLIEGRARARSCVPANTLEELVASLATPRKVFLMVKAGKPVDEVIASSRRCSSKGDILIDGGNSFFQDTIRRTREAEAKGCCYIGTGVSGGEEGALHGPSIMPGGHARGLRGGGEDPPRHLREGRRRPVLHLHRPRRRGPLREDGPQRHRVRRHGADQRGVLHHEERPRHEPRRDAPARSRSGTTATSTPTSSRSPRTSSRRKDPDTGQPLVEVILDKAGQKGTGKWTTQSALDLGVAAPTIAEAVFARCISAIKKERVEAAKVLKRPGGPFHGRPEGVRRRHPRRAVRVEDLLVRPGVRPDEGRGRGVPLGPEVRRDLDDLARGMHHPRPLPRQDQGRLRPRPDAAPTSCSIRTSARWSSAASASGGRSWPRRRSWAFPSPPSPPPSPTTTATAPRASART